MTKSIFFGRTGHLPARKPRWWRSFGLIAVLAAILGVLSIVLAPIVFVVGMISVIGIPIAFAALLFPTLCLAVVIAYAVFRIKPQWTAFGIARSFAIAFIIMLALPQIHNAQVRGAVSNLNSGDKSATLSSLDRGETLAVVHTDRSPAKCFQQCLDLLLSGQISAYVTAVMPRNTIQPTGKEKAILHRFVRATHCENEMALPRNKSSNEGIAGTVAFKLKAAAERGICLESTRTTLAEIASFRAVLYLDKKDLDYPKKALLINTEIRPSRIVVFEKSKGQELSRIAQQTNVSYSLLKPFLAYSVSGGQISNMSSSWWRDSVRAEYLSVNNFLTRNMGARFQKN